MPDIRAGRGMSAAFGHRAGSGVVHTSDAGREMGGDVGMDDMSMDVKPGPGCIAHVTPTYYTRRPGACVRVRGGRGRLDGRGRGRGVGCCVAAKDLGSQYTALHTQTTDIKRV